ANQPSQRILSPLRPIGGQFGPLARLDADGLVHAERQQLDQQVLPLGRLRVQELGEPALRQQYRLGEVFVGQSEDLGDRRLNLVGSLGKRFDASFEQVSQRRVGRHAQI